MPIAYGKMRNNIYYDIEQTEKYKQPYNFVIGGRGTGKTYGTLKYMVENKHKFVLLRRTQTELNMTLDSKHIDLGDTSMNVDISPFKKLASDLDWKVEIHRVNKDLYAIVINGELLGYGMSLNTMHKIRGFDASDVEYIVYDEFIPQRQARPIPDEGGAFFNAYETINRNREIEGREPVRAYLLANANNIEAQILEDTGLSTVIEHKMINKGKKFHIDSNRGYTIELLGNARFSEEKKKGVLYRFTKGTQFSRMAFENQFAYDDFTNIRQYNIREYLPYFAVGDYGIYTHKSRDEYYISKCKQSFSERFPFSDYGIKQSIRAHGRELYKAYMESRIFFESYECKKLLTKIVG